MTLRDAIRLSVGLAAAILPLSASSQPAQAYPNAPIRLIVPYPAGGSNDTIARIVTDKVGTILGQPIVIENRPGAGTALGAQLAARSAPDGYTLFMGSLASHATAPYLLKNPGFDALKDFTPISLLAVAPTTLIVPNDFPANSVAEFLKLVKANPGKYTYASGGIGSPPQLSAEMFKARTGTNIVHIPYKGAPQNILDLASGRVDSLFDTTIATIPYIKSGKVKALAIASPKRSPALPDVPTFAEGGVPGFEVYGWYGMFAIAKTPPEILKKLNEAFVKAVAMPDVQEKFRALGMEPKGTSPQEFDALVRSENTKYGKIIRDAGIQLE